MPKIKAENRNNRHNSLKRKKLVNRQLRPGIESLKENMNWILH